MICPVYDHEILGNTMAWQAPSDMQNILTSTQKLWIGHLRPMPQAGPPNAARVFREYDDYDQGLVPLSETFNGPEVGLDESAGVEVAIRRS
jgi:hypothetical protein